MLRFTDMQAAGLLPHFFDEADPRPAREQLHENYAHGGGVMPFEGFVETNLEVPGGAYLTWLSASPEEPDEVYREVSRATLRGETLVLFDCAFLAIYGANPDDGVLVTRVD